MADERPAWLTPDPGTSRMTTDELLDVVLRMFAFGDDRRARAAQEIIATRASDPVAEAEAATAGAVGSTPALTRLVARARKSPVAPE